MASKQDRREQPTLPSGNPDMGSNDFMSLDLVGDGSSMQSIQIQSTMQQLAQLPAIAHIPGLDFSVLTPDMGSISKKRPLAAPV